MENDIFGPPVAGTSDRHAVNAYSRGTVLVPDIAAGATTGAACTITRAGVREGSATAGLAAVDGAAAAAAASSDRAIYGWCCSL